jgi:hypothetical protein
MYIYVFICIYINMHIYIHIYMYVYIYVYIERHTFILYMISSIIFPNGKSIIETDEDFLLNLLFSPRN